jgi:hypothetical protein
MASKGNDAKEEGGSGGPEKVEHEVGPGLG